MVERDVKKPESQTGKPTVIHQDNNAAITMKIATVLISGETNIGLCAEPISRRSLEQGV